MMQAQFSQLRISDTVFAAIARFQRCSVTTTLPTARAPRSIPIHFVIMSLPSVHIWPGLIWSVGLKLRLERATETYDLPPMSLPE